LAESELKPGKKKVAKKPLKSNRIAKRVSKTTRGKKRNQKKKAVKKVKTKSKKSLKKVPLEKTADEIVEKDVERTPHNIISNNISSPIENVIENGGSGKNQNAIITTDRFFHDTPKTNFFIILSILSIIIFLAAGYVYPATEDDIVKGKVIWNYEGKFDRGLFSQFYASMAFTLGVFLLGYYVYATFIKFNVKKWNYFASGILLMFFFGLGKIGELVYNHDIFGGFKDLVLPIALTMLAFATYIIYKDMNGVI
jgi:hypothetical protein